MPPKTKYNVQPKVVGLILPLLLFIFLAFQASKHMPSHFDTSVLVWIHSHSTGFFDTFFHTITKLGNTVFIAPAVLLLSLYIWYRKWRSQAVFLFVGFFGSGAINFVLKLLFQRDRPSLWQRAITETSFSFPSGHAVASSALAFSLIVICWNTRWRWPAVIGGFGFMLLISFSRLYLGVHYPTDILAGWTLSVLWVSLCYLVYFSRRAAVIKVNN